MTKSWLLQADGFSPPVLNYFIIQILNCCWFNIYRRGVHL